MSCDSKKMRKLALALLCDDNGISLDAYDALYEILHGTENQDILRHVDATDGRFYLPESYSYDKSS